MHASLKKNDLLLAHGVHTTQILLYWKRLILKILGKIFVQPVTTIKEN